MSSPRVFVSYSHDSTEHSDWVRKLANDLRERGIDTFLDVWDLRPGDNFVERIQSAVESAEYCIAICSPRYREVAERRRRDGIGYEQALIQDVAESKPPNQPWVLPILRSGHGREAIPDWLMNRMYVDFTDDYLYGENLQKLLDALSSRHKPESVPAYPSPKNLATDSKNVAVTLTIDASFESSDDDKLKEILSVLRSYLGDDVTITESSDG